MKLNDFVLFTDHARSLIPRGKVDWSDSPFAWIRHNGPRTKSKLARDIIEEWLKFRGVAYEVSDNGVAHFVVEGQQTIVHLGLLSKEGVFEFAQLRAPGKGVEWMLLLGIEPHRARIWATRPTDVTHLATYGTDAPGLHHCAFDPDEPPAWLRELACWDEGSDPQGGLF